jgi:hypothetical protein
MVKQPDVFMMGAGGLKSVSLESLPAEAWTWHTRSTDTSDLSKYKKSVPWLSRGIALRAQTLSALPFAIVKDKPPEVAKTPEPEEEPEPEPEPVEGGPPLAKKPPKEKKPDKPEPDPDFDTSDTWQNKINCIPDPVNLLYRIEASLAVYGCCYLLREQRENVMTKAVRTSGLRYVLPTTIQPIIGPDATLTGFKRSVGNRIIELSPEALIYFWLPDEEVECGPPGRSAVGSALAAAGVLYNVDRFATNYFQSGAIKATLLKLPSPASPDERDRLKAWWKRVTSGISRAWTTEIAATDLTVEQIGDGLEGLTDTNLIASKREDIATGLGVPHSLLFSNAANYATAETDVKSFLNHTILPDALFIAGVLNSQLLKPSGYRWEFRPETLDVFQTEEADRAGAFKLYVDAGIKRSIACQMVGLELPSGVKPEDLDPKEKTPEEIAAATPPQLLPFVGPGANPPAQPGQPPKPPTARENMDADLERWQRKAVKRAREGKPGPVPFESEFIPAELKAGIEHNIGLLGPEEAFAFLKKNRLPYIEPEDVTKLRVRVQRAIAPILARYQTQIVDAIEAGELTEAALDEMGAELRAALTPELALIIGRQVAGTTASFGITFDAALVNAEAIAWAQSYSFNLVRGLTDTTRKLLQQATSTFMGTPGMTRGQLESLIEPAFGAARAEMIAVTEVTRAYSEATAQQQEWLESMGIRMRRVWLTLNDELVCPICGPFHGRQESDRGIWTDDGGNVYDGPPAHPNCRCSAELEL